MNHLFQENSERRLLTASFGVMFDRADPPSAASLVLAAKSSLVIDPDVVMLSLSPETKPDWRDGD